MAFSHTAAQSDLHVLSVQRFNFTIKFTGFGPQYSNQIWIYYLNTTYQKSSRWDTNQALVEYTYQQIDFQVQLGTGMATSYRDNVQDFNACQLDGQGEQQCQTAPFDLPQDEFGIDFVYYYISTSNTQIYMPHYKIVSYNSAPYYAENGIIKIPFLKFPTTNTQYYIYGRTSSNLYAFSKVFVLNVCGLETVSLTSGNTSFWYQNKNQTVTMEVTFSSSKVQCPVTQASLINTTDVIVTIGSIDSTTGKLVFTFDLTKYLVQHKFQVQVKTDMNKKINQEFVINVCDWGTISTIQLQSGVDNNINILAQLGNGVKTTTLQQASNYFKTTGSNCTIYYEQIVYVNPALNAPAADIGSLTTINSLAFRYDVRQQGTMIYYIRAMSSFQVFSTDYVKISIIICQESLDPYQNVIPPVEIYFDAIGLYSSIFLNTLVINQPECMINLEQIFDNNQQTPISGLTVGYDITGLNCSSEEAAAKDSDCYIPVDSGQIITSQIQLIAVLDGTPAAKEQSLVFQNYYYTQEFSIVMAVNDPGKVTPPSIYSQDITEFFYLDELPKNMIAPETNRFKIEPFICIFSCSVETYWATNDSQTLSLPVLEIKEDSDVNSGANFYVEIANSVIKDYSFYLYGAKRQDAQFDKSYGLIAPGLISLKVVCGKEFLQAYDPYDVVLEEIELGPFSYDEAQPVMISLANTQRMIRFVSDEQRCPTSYISLFDCLPETAEQELQCRQTDSDLIKMVSPQDQLITRLSITWTEGFHKTLYIRPQTSGFPQYLQTPLNSHIYLKTVISVCGKETLTLSNEGSNNQSFVEPNKDEIFKIPYQNFSTWFNPIDPGVDSHKDCFVMEYTLFKGALDSECDTSLGLWEDFVNINLDPITDKKIFYNNSIGTEHAKSKFQVDEEYKDRAIEVKQSQAMDYFLCLQAKTRGNVVQYVKMRVEVCGDEKISIDESQLLQEKIYFNPVIQQWIIPLEEYSKWFAVSRPNCTIQQIKIGSREKSTDLTTNNQDYMDKTFFMNQKKEIIFNTLSTEFNSTIFGQKIITNVYFQVTSFGGRFNNTVSIPFTFKLSNMVNQHPQFIASGAQFNFDQIIMVTMSQIDQIKQRANSHQPIVIQLPDVLDDIENDEKIFTLTPQVSWISLEEPLVNKKFADPLKSHPVDLVINKNKITSINNGRRNFKIKIQNVNSLEQVKLSYSFTVAIDYQQYESSSSLSIIDKIIDKNIKFVCFEDTECFLDKELKPNEYFRLYIGLPNQKDQLLTNKNYTIFDMPLKVTNTSFLCGVTLFGFNPNEGQLNACFFKVMSKSITIVDFTGEYNEVADPPNLWLDLINSQHKFNISFDQDMVQPTILQAENQLSRDEYENNILDYYQTIFEINIESSSDGSKKTSLNNSQIFKRNLQEGPDCQAQYSCIKFSWSILDRSSKHLEVQLNFSDVSIVSPAEKDVIVVRVIDPSKLISNENGQLVNVKDLQCNNKNSQLCAKIPQFLDADSRLFLMDINQKSQSIMTIIIYGSLSQSKIFEFIRQLQFISMTSLVNIDMPANAEFVFSFFVEYSSIDIFFGTELNYYLFEEFINDEPYNDKFAFFGIESQNLLVNSGSLIFPILAMILAIFLTAKLLHKIARIFYQNSRCRRMGMVVQNEQQFKFLIKDLTIFYIEAYLELSYAIILQLNSLEDFDLQQFFERPGDSFSTVLTFICVIFHFLVPVSILIITYKYYGGLEWWVWKDDLRIQDELLLQRSPFINILYQDFHNKNIWSSLYFFFFLFRRLLTVLVIIFMQNSLIQVIILIVTSMFNLIYLLKFKPFEDKFSQKFEIFNELTVLVNLYIYLMYAGEEYHIDQKTAAGWLSISNLVFNMCFNLATFSVGQIISIYQWYQKRKFLQEKQKKKDEMFKHRYLLVKQFPGQFFHIEQAVREKELKEKCRQWKPHRDWLRNNGIQFSHLAEEIEFQDILSKNSYVQRFKNIQGRTKIRVKQKLMVKKMNKAKQFQEKLQKLMPKAPAPPPEPKKIEVKLPVVEESKFESEQSEEEEKIAPNKVEWENGRARIVIGEESAEIAKKGFLQQKAEGYDAPLYFLPGALVAEEEKKEAVPEVKIKKNKEWDKVAKKTLLNEEARLRAIGDPHQLKLDAQRAEEQRKKRIAELQQFDPEDFVSPRYQQDIVKLQNLRKVIYDDVMKNGAENYHGQLVKIDTVLIQEQNRINKKKERTKQFLELEAMMEFDQMLIDNYRELSLKSSNELNDFDFMSDFSEFQREINQEEIKIVSSNFVKLDEAIPEGIKMSVANLDLERSKQHQIIIEEKVQPFNHHGIVTLLDPKSDSQVTCVVQCLLGFQNLEMYYMLKQFKNGFTSRRHRKLTDLLKELFRDVHSIKDKQAQVLVESLGKIRRKVVKGLYDPAELLQELLRKMHLDFWENQRAFVYDESRRYRTKRVVLEFQLSNSSYVAKSFNTLYRKEQICEKCKNEQKTFSSNCLLKLDVKGKSLEEIVSHHFSERLEILKDVFTCPKCDHASLTCNQKHNIVWHSPYLVIQLNRFHHLFSSTDAISIPVLLNLQAHRYEFTGEVKSAVEPNKHLREVQKKIDQSQTFKYKLNAVLCQNGAPGDDSCVAYVQKMGKWYKFAKKYHTKIEEEQMLEEVKHSAYILFYSN